MVLHYHGLTIFFLHVKLKFFFHMPYERFTFSWLCVWYGRLLFNLIFNNFQREITRPNLRKKILENFVELFLLHSYAINVTFKCGLTRLSKIHVKKLSENKLRSLFVGMEGEAFSYPANITKSCLTYAKRFSCFALFQKVYAGFLHNYTKIMPLGFRILKSVPSDSKPSNSV